MPVIAFDTLAYSNKLQEGGIPREQAEAIARANVDAFRSLVTSQQLATKQDIAELRQELKQDNAELRQELKQDNAELRQELKQDNAELRQELKQDNTDLRQETKQDIAAVRQEIADTRHFLERKIDDTRHEVLKWVIGMMIAQTTLILTAFGIGIAILK